MELFDSITHELMLDGENWTDVSGDVLLRPGARINSRGIMGNGPNDRVAGVGRVTFYLDNSENNSASQLGYYSPGNSNVRTGFDSGIRYRITFVKEGVSWMKFHGRVSGITPVPGQYGTRRTKVVVQDWMGQAMGHALGQMALATNKTIDEVIALIIADMDVAPLNTSLATGETTFPTVFDTTAEGTKAAAELKKLAMSEVSVIYVTGNQTDGETLVSESRDGRTGSVNAQLIVSTAEADNHLNEDGGIVLNEDGGNNLLDETTAATFTNKMLPTSKIGWGSVFNQIKGMSVPREVGVSNEVLFTLQRVISIEAGETTTVNRVTYRDPGGSAARCGGKTMVTPVEGTDYTANTQEDGGGADIKADLDVTIIGGEFGTYSVEYTLTNNNAATMYVTLLQFRGLKILTYDPVFSIQEDTTSQAKHGLKPLNVKMVYLDDPTVADGYTSSLLGRFQDPSLSADKIRFNTATNSMTMYGFLQLEPGTRVEIVETVSGISGDWFVNGYDAKIIDGRFVDYGLVLSDASQFDFWVLGVSELGINTTLGFNT